jgi:Short-chain dehydrogenases of various substrate specificities
VATNFSGNAVRGTDRKKMGDGGRGISAEQVAQATLSGYLKRRREVIVPWFYNLVILAYRLLPGPIEKTMRARMRPLP